MKALSAATYAGLRKKVQEVLLLGQQKIEEAKVRTYWETGRLINEYLRKDETPNQEHGEQIVAHLAKDLGFGETVFYRCMRFAEQFPTLAARPKLTWAHYRALVAVPDEKKRLALADEASRGEWTSRDLEIEVRNLNWESRALASDGKPLSLLPVPELGPFFIYRILAPKTVQPKEEGLLLVDLGFASYRDLDAVTSKTFKPFDIIESVKTGDDQYRLQKNESRAASPESLFTYSATVEKIVDGDTLRVIVDLGFNVRTRQYIRLKGIDCPEIDTPQGLAAKKFVVQALQGLETITLKTVKSDKYDRYLADVFLPARSDKTSAAGTGATGPECHTDKAGNQQYLNNLLLEKGMAVRVRE
jgi:endonuclease YncB( thermonuclease family)